MGTSTTPDDCELVKASQIIVFFFYLIRGTGSWDELYQDISEALLALGITWVAKSSFDIKIKGNIIRDNYCFHNRVALMHPYHLTTTTAIKCKKNKPTRLRMEEHLKENFIACWLSKYIIQFMDVSCEICGSTKQLGRKLYYQWLVVTVTNYVLNNSFYRPTNQEMVKEMNL